MKAVEQLGLLRIANILLALQSPAGRFAKKYCTSFSSSPLQAKTLEGLAPLRPRPRRSATLHQNRIWIEVVFENWASTESASIRLRLEEVNQNATGSEKSVKQEAGSVIDGMFETLRTAISQSVQSQP